MNRDLHKSGGPAAPDEAHGPRNDTLALGCTVSPLARAAQQFAGGSELYTLAKPAPGSSCSAPVTPALGRRDLASPAPDRDCSQLTADLAPRVERRPAQLRQRPTPQAALVSCRQPVSDREVCGSALDAPHPAMSPHVDGHVPPPPPAVPAACSSSPVLPSHAHTVPLLESHCANRVATGAAVGGALGASIGAHACCCCLGRAAAGCHSRAPAPPAPPRACPNRRYVRYVRGVPVQGARPAQSAVHRTGAVRGSGGRAATAAERSCLCGWWMVDGSCWFTPA